MRTALISGASIAGLTSALLLHDLGFRVTVVELASALRVGGTAVDLRDESLAVARRLGIYDDLVANKLSLGLIEFKNADDVTEGSMVVDNDTLEIERSRLVQLLFERASAAVELVFGDSITAIHDREVVFHSGVRRSFDLVIGADGTHSVVRQLQFGDEASFVHFLGAYFSISIVNKSLIPPNTLQMFNVPNKVVMLNAYKDKTDIVFSFRSEELVYDFRDAAGQRAIIDERLAGEGWRTAELRDEIHAASNFYFDKFCQVRMPSWTKGRVVLVGDAAYCASPAAGMGGALAIEGAAALVGAIEETGGDLDAAFQLYDQRFRPIMIEVQATAEAMLASSLIPTTTEAIRERNTRGGW